MAINFKGTLKEIRDSIPLLRDIAILGTTTLLIVGVILEVATDGSISMFSAIQTFLNGTWGTDIVTAFTNLSSAWKIALSLLVVVIVMYLFKVKDGGKSGSNI
jgi:hypothetical protein